MDDYKFMRAAIEAAKKADFAVERTVVGAVVVNELGEILSIAYNTAKKDGDPTAHAEMNAIRRASEKIGSKNLPGCTLYTTVEPCLMCFGAAYSAKIPRIVYGLDLEDLAEAGHRDWKIKAEALNQQIGNPIEIEGGVLKEECKSLLVNRED
ncbi:nucleoside deaminase [Candidatus Woesearchaeota archaeon]|nr:nucleoside deaminase [Candidatus Woesearchaeota archaeon]